MKEEYLPSKIVVNELKKIYQNEIKAITVAAGINHWCIFKPTRLGAKWAMSLFGMSWDPIHPWVEARRHGIIIKNATLIQTYSELPERLPDSYHKQITECMRKAGIIGGCPAITGNDIDRALAVYEDFFNIKEGEEFVMRTSQWGPALLAPVVMADRLYRLNEVTFKRSSDMVYCDYCGDLIPCCEHNREISTTGEAVCSYCHAAMVEGRSHSCEAYECHAIECPYSSWADLHQGVKRHDNSVQKYSASSGALF